MRTAAITAKERRTVVETFGRYEEGHPRYFLRAIAPRLSSPYRPHMLLRLASQVPGFGEVGRHWTLNRRHLFEQRLRGYAGAVCKEMGDVSYADGPWAYVSINDAALEDLAWHLLWQESSNVTRDRNFIEKWTTFDAKCRAAGTTAKEFMANFKQEMADHRR